MTEGKVPARIFYVENDESHRFLFTEMVRLLAPDVAVSAIESGEQLLQQLETGTQLPDVIFLDMRMPLYSGLQTLHLLRLNPTLKHIPVIIYSNSTDQRDIEACYHNDATLYIPKPMEYEDSVLVMKYILLKEWGEHKRPPFENFVLQAHHLRK